MNSVHINKKKMKTSQIFENEDQSSSDESNNFKTNNEYAKKYDVWRKKEELNKLKTKYGDDVMDVEDSSSSSSDDEEGVELTEEIEKDFFRTLSCLKKKDPSIYKNDVNFFKNVSSPQTTKKKKDKPMFLKDYERNLILEKGGILSDDEEVEIPGSPTYKEEQTHIKESFKNALANSDEENDENWGGIFQERKKTQEDVEKEESVYKKWLAGQNSNLEDKQVENDLKSLKDYWNNPNLDEGEKFLKEYILNKKYLDTENDDYIPTYEEVVHDSDQDLSNDEENLEKQEEFEHKFNFRYEEPDQEFIKRYPRTMENSLRKTDDKRKVKRQEVKERKKKEKEEKMQDLKKMQELKRKEIEEKLEKLKEITGNESLGFGDKDLDGDFDPEEHDKKMQALFDDEFYAAPEDEQKPEFPDLDKELEIENWERYTGEDNKYEPHCEDDDFNMNCDYDPQTSKNNDDDNVKEKRKGRKKSKFANAVSKPKPKFDPSDKKFEKYFDEYYKLDCEDIIGDIPCRFKYRNVVANDFGLSTEEILLANERELNKWCSLKKTVQFRSDEVEKYEQIAYKRKGQNINLKKKILPSLFSEIPDETNLPNSEINTSIQNEKQENKTVTEPNIKEFNKTLPRSENKEVNETLTKSDMKEVNETLTKSDIKEKSDPSINTEKVTVKNKTKKKKNKNKKQKVVVDKISATPLEMSNKKRKRNDTDTTEPRKQKKKFREEKNKKLPISDARLSAYGINPKKYKNKLKYKQLETR